MSLLDQCFGAVCLFSWLLKTVTTGAECVILVTVCFVEAKGAAL